MENKENISKAFRIIFWIINIIYMVMGLTLLILGAKALSDVVTFNTDDVKPLLDAVKVDSFQVGTMAISLFITYIIIGVFILIVAGMSFFWRQNNIFVVYAVLVLVLFVIQIVFIVLLYTMKNKVEGSEMKAKMSDNLISIFKDDTITNANSVSNAWNYIFMSLDCCAVNAVSGTANDFDHTSWCTTSGSCQATASQIPKTCCLNVDENNYSSAPSGCHASVNPGTYYSKGCYDALKDKLLSETDSIAGVAITIIILEVVAVAVGFAISITFPRYPWKHIAVAPG